MSLRPTVLRGRSLVLSLYALVVAFAGVAGALIGAFGPSGLQPVALLGVVELPPTSVGLAIYGVVTVGTVLGVPLALVVIVSRRAETG